MTGRLAATVMRRRTGRGGEQPATRTYLCDLMIYCCPFPLTLCPVSRSAVGTPAARSGSLDQSPNVCSADQLSPRSLDSTAFG
ncbi:hypothetical protein CH063_04822 [Colletotrichum higginsianum]|uniref:Uncharacterized protein n=1 Tax=Colletotrichum higginsianum (strain IMI 349063) TaxID=759273 RepID=H1UWS4_COLHI|nr:hypothetical protein CH063_04822 [Colletotrichum higginsianum]